MRSVQVMVCFTFLVPDAIPGVPLEGSDEFYLNVVPGAIFELMRDVGDPVDAKFVEYETYEVWDNTGDDLPGESQQSDEFAEMVEAWQAARIEEEANTLRSVVPVWKETIGDCDD